MKITETKTPLPKDNIYGIKNFEAYDEYTATASEGRNKASQSFPWHKSIPSGDSCVVRAKKICLDGATDSLLQYLNRWEVKHPVLAFLRREWRFMKMMWGWTPRAER